jgi:hypothetical protein
MSSSSMSSLSGRQNDCRSRCNIAAIGPLTVITSYLLSAFTASDLWIEWCALCMLHTGATWTKTLWLVMLMAYGRDEGHDAVRARSR